VDGAEGEDDSVVEELSIEDEDSNVDEIADEVAEGVGQGPSKSLYVQIELPESNETVWHVPETIAMVSQIPEHSPSCWTPILTSVELQVGDTEVAVDETVVEDISDEDKDGVVAVEDDDSTTEDSVLVEVACTVVDVAEVVDATPDDEVPGMDTTAEDDDSVEEAKANVDDVAEDDDTQEDIVLELAEVLVTVGVVETAGVAARDDVDVTKVERVEVLTDDGCIEDGDARIVEEARADDDFVPPHSP
jgi:hypothetical protein